jgi:hypothetical protein
MSDPFVTDDLEPPVSGVGLAPAKAVVTALPTGKRRSGSRPKTFRDERSDVYTAKLADGFVLQYGSDVVWDLTHRLPMKVSALRHVYGNDAVKAWLGSERRRLVMPEQVVFDPTESVPEHYVNLFGGIEMEPRPGDVSVILALLEHLCGGDKAAMEFVLNWLALPLQRPGTKMRSALIVHGPEGSGKNLFFEIVRDIYGRYALVVGQDQLEDKFNDWLSCKLFIIGDEVVTRQELRHHKGRLKALVSGSELQINTKMMPLRREANHVNLVFLSNEVQPLELDASDRRYCVLWTPAALPKPFYEAVGHCLASGGRQAFYDYLLNRDLTFFDEFTPPPAGDAKKALIEVSLRPPERFVREWLGGLLPLPVRPCSVEQLFRAYRRWCNATGVRWSGEQAAFTNTIGKAAGDQLECKVVNVPHDRGRKSARCWLPQGTGPTEGVSLGSFVGDAIAAFEDDLRRYTHTGEAHE